MHNLYEGTYKILLKTQNLFEPIERHVLRKTQHHKDIYCDPNKDSVKFFFFSEAKQVDNKVHMEE